MSARSRASRLCYAAVGIAAAVAASPCFASDSVSALLACRRIEASAARLACFDRESAALAGQRSSAAPTTGQRSSAAPAPTLNPRDTFGLAPLQVAARAEEVAHAPKPLAAVAARITNLSRAADGREVFTLDNHQVWVQLVPDGDWLDARTGEKVTISRGWLDSYRLSLPSHRGVKVTRLR